MCAVSISSSLHFDYVCLNYGGHIFQLGINILDLFCLVEGYIFTLSLLYPTKFKKKFMKSGTNFGSVSYRRNLLVEAIEL